MLHPAKLERRDQHEVELAERVRNRRVVLEPGERVGVQVEDRRPIACDLRGVRLTVEHAELPSIAFGRFDAELAGGEREEVRRNRLRLVEDQAEVIGRRRAARLAAVRHGDPVGRHLQAQAPAGLQIRLVEAWDRERRARRHEQRVEVVVVAIERLVAGDELELDRVVASRERPRRQHDVAVLNSRRDLMAVRFHATQVIARLREIERERRRPIAQGKRRGQAALDGIVSPGRDAHRELVPEIRHAGRAIFREGERHAARRRRGIAPQRAPGRGH